MEIDEIYDISALRVVVGTVEECYQVLGIIHSLWRPVPGRLKDFIANPKPNGYQSIHTTVATGDGSFVEIQIRSRSMQEAAEFGLASHIFYDESGKPKKGGRMPKNLSWIQELIDWQKKTDAEKNEDFINGLRDRFFHDRIFVFTPKNEVVELPKGSTPIDFAFAIHSAIGYHAGGARIGGKMVTLDTKLRNGDHVEIITNKHSTPRAKWLDYVRTSDAKKHIKSFLQQQDSEK